MLINIMRDANAMGAPHVTEVFSPPRVASLAKRFELRPGCALDLTTTDDEDGQPWDFSLASKRDKAMRLIETTSPAFVVLSYV